MAFLIIKARLHDCTVKRCLTLTIMICAGTVPPQNYTPADAMRFFEDAGLTVAESFAHMLLNRSSETKPPGTNFYGFIGTGALQCCSHADLIKPSLVRTTKLSSMLINPYIKRLLEYQMHNICISSAWHLPTVGSGKQISLALFAQTAHSTWHGRVILLCASSVHLGPDSLMLKPASMFVCRPADFGWQHLHHSICWCTTSEWWGNL